MPFTSYDDLQTSIGRWLKRNNLADSAPDFIALAEVSLNRKIRVRQMRTYFTVTPSTAFITLPGDYNEAIRLTYGDQKLELMSEDAASVCMNMGGGFNNYTIAGNKIWLLTQVDGTTKFTLHYYQSIEALSESNTSNWLLEDAPDVYLYASLMMAEAFIKNDDRVPGWKAARDTALDELEQNDNSGQFSGSALAMRAT